MAYRGCFKRNIDGTNRLIKKGDVCSRPTNIPFWMSIQDNLENKVPTQESRSFFKSIHAWSQN